jgi:CRISPR-associated exonuclease Cas4
MSIARGSRFHTFRNIAFRSSLARVPILPQACGPDLDDDWSSGSGFTEGMVEADGQSIEIVTVHSSKGLEWPVVIPINRASMPRRAEAFVYRRSDESLHWALGQVTPPSLEDALRGENAEKRNENLRLLYVACTRAMELLVIPAGSATALNPAMWRKG